MRIDIGYRTRNRERTLLHLYDNHSIINSILLTLRRSIPSIAGATAAHPVQMALGKIKLTKSSLGMFWQYNEDKCHVQQVNDVNIIKYSPVKKKKGFLRTGRDTRQRVTGETHRERAAPGEMHREKRTGREQG